MAAYTSTAFVGVMNVPPLLPTPTVTIGNKQCVASVFAQPGIPTSQVSTTAPNPKPIYTSIPRTP